mmetsp:Transcript_3104/g.4519  ORF Transcript_3104/g.4519 Transcript_3104/m.4519 type:complete len:197 (-) Transcript_3104:1137-1727(-)
MDDNTKHKIPKIADASSLWPISATATATGNTINLEENHDYDWIEKKKSFLISKIMTNHHCCCCDDHVLMRNDDDGQAHYCWRVTIHNESPTWERVVAEVLLIGGEQSSVPANSVVIAELTTAVWPASATFAPNGGCDNLCNTAERYTDSIEFTVDDNMVADPTTTATTTAYLIILTEEKEWCFRLSKETAHNSTQE